MDKLLFIDRDGTLIREPADEQIDSLEKLEFLPGVFCNLYLIQHLLNYRLIMVSNQDGLGTERYPREAFEQVQAKLLRAFENEGIRFEEILIDDSTAENPSPNRKPQTGLVKSYLQQSWDREASFVIGDRPSDVELAANMGIKGILMNDQKLEDRLQNAFAVNNASWDDIFYFLKNADKSASINRVTSETTINGKLQLNGSGSAVIKTGLGFFDHMLEQLVRHGSFDLQLDVKGDLRVDEHHTIEDTALALGEAFARALENKKGLQRYGFVLPMDESKAEVAVDFGGRPELVWKAYFKREKIGDMPAEMFYHFFKSFADAARCNLHIRALGNNEHHKIESIFKAVGRAFKMALKRDELDPSIPTTKGLL